MYFRDNIKVLCSIIFAFEFLSNFRVPSLYYKIKIHSIAEIKNFNLIRCEIFPDTFIKKM